MLTGSGTLLAGAIGGLLRGCGGGGGGGAGLGGLFHRGLVLLAASEVLFICLAPATPRSCDSHLGFATETHCLPSSA